jgi:hypothetical protein
VAVGETSWELQRSQIKRGEKALERKVRAVVKQKDRRALDAFFGRDPEKRGTLQKASLNEMCPLYGGERTS